MEFDGKKNKILYLANTVIRQIPLCTIYEAGANNLNTKSYTRK